MWTRQTDKALPDGALKVVRVIREPTVTLKASTALDSETYAEMVYHESSFTKFDAGKSELDIIGRDAAWLIEFAGRECYQSWDNPAKRESDDYVRNIIRQAHLSVLEHVNVTFRLEGISRSLTHDLVRHRHFSFSQLSQRYVDSRDSWYVCPPLFLTDYELYLEWEKLMLRINEGVNKLETLVTARHPDLPKKQVREAVRSAVPNSIETKLVITGNLRTWYDFLPKRLSPAADQEIQRLARALYAQLNALYPFVFEGIKP